MANLFDAAEFGKAERFKTLLGDQDPDMPIGEGESGVVLEIDKSLPTPRIPTPSFTKAIILVLVEGL